jgi:hypothetical protein
MCKYIRVFIGGEGKWSGNRIAYSVEPNVKTSSGIRTKVVLKVATGKMTKNFKVEDVEVMGVIEK